MYRGHYLGGEVVFVEGRDVGPVEKVFVLKVLLIEGHGDQAAVDADGLMGVVWFGLIGGLLIAALVLAWRQVFGG